ncbi:3320_t:CDS:1 [Funneliformis geosporum]|uniref:20051_t:CDS:1 n=1 Tax=Funneliformis geosporum TaxID=1117311 RepID=A0A9W4S9Q8_9GLOM|nr:20051_t:CDS:1 [Funneliformis geosporum]CAI2162015.1 3320_t:CDS:1 [Funneliformis geosporum]
MPKSNEKSSDDLADFKLPFPPRITAHEVVSMKKKKGKKPSKSSNAFMIYRKVFSKEVAKIHRFQQKKISPICGHFWNREPKYVKDVYRQLATEVDKLFLQLREETSLQDRIEWNMKAIPKITSQRLEKPSPSILPELSIDYYLKEFENLPHDPYNNYENIDINDPIAPENSYFPLPLMYPPAIPYYNWNFESYEMQPPFYHFQIDSNFNSNILFRNNL